MACESLIDETTTLGLTFSFIPLGYTRKGRSEGAARGAPRRGVIVQAPTVFVRLIAGHCKVFAVLPYLKTATRFQCPSQKSTFLLNNEARVSQITLKMRGSVKFQCNAIYHKSGIDQIGQSRKSAKEEARQSGSKTAHEVGKKTGVHSFKTKETYLTPWRGVLSHAKENFGVKDIEKITGDHVRSYLLSKIDERVSKSTFKTYASAMQKLEVALNRFNDSNESFHGKIDYNFTQDINDVRELGRDLAPFAGTRAYDDPHELVRHVEDRFRLLAEIQLEAGLRVHELGTIRPEKTFGEQKFTLVPGRKAGVFEVKGKGGKVRKVGVSPQTYQKMLAALDSNGGRFRFSEKEYNEALKGASERTGQSYNASHGLRWNYAREMMVSLQRDGKHSYEQSLRHVSEMMGHNRPDITEHYLR